MTKLHMNHKDNTKPDDARIKLCTKYKNITKPEGYVYEKKK